MLQVQLLGQFDVRVGGIRVSIPSRVGQSLFAFLILTAGKAHRREKLAGQFWPDTSDDQARRNLRQELWRIRKALIARQPSAANYLLAEELTLTFNSDVEYWLDVAQLERRLSPTDDLNQPISQVALYQGELLPGLYDDWVVLERERLQALFESRMRQLLERLIEEQRWVTVLEWAERWIALGSTPEPAYRALMLAFAALGDKSKVISTYGRCVEALDKELSVEPSNETRALHDQLRLGQAVTGVDLSATRVSLARAPALHDPPAPGEPPFKGLQYFDEADAALFFGRELLTAKLIGRLRESRFLAVVVGASGSGKSSMVRAGVIPALRRGEPLADGTLPPEGSARWQMHVITPTAHPLEALAVSLTRDSESVTAPATLMDDLAREARSLHLFVRRASAGSENTSHLLLVVDQFEELFTLCRDTFEREAFIDNLLAAVAPDAGGLVTLVITIRADFYAHLAQYPELRDVVAQQQEYIGPMTLEELRRAIEEPATRSGWEFQPGLVDVMLRDVGDEPGTLPLLSHALLETWKRRSGHLLTLKGYADSGGVRGAIAHTAETVYQALTPTQQAIARNIFLRLTELGEGTEDTRRRAPLRELVTQSKDEVEVRTVLTKLADVRLITTSAEGAEVAHEALIREWSTLREWLTQDREGLVLHRHLTDAAREWELLESDPDVLYRGARLAQASEWAAAHTSELNVLEGTFLEASQALAEWEVTEREAQRQRELQAAQVLAETERRAAVTLRRRAFYLTGAFILAIILAGAALFFGAQARQSAVAADSERRIAFSRELAAAAISNLTTDPERSILLALEAVSTTIFAGLLVPMETEDALHQAVLASRVRLTLRGHADGLTSVAFSPDGSRLATASKDWMVKVWDASTGEELLNLSSHTDWVNQVTFSSDGSRLATASSDGTAKVWDAVSGQELLTLSGDTGPVMSVAFSPDGTRLATAGGEAALKAWQAVSGINPDGAQSASPSGDGIVKIWDAVSGEQLLSFSSMTRGVLDIAISPDGKYLALAGTEATAKVFDMATGKPVLTLFGHANTVLGDNIFSITFSPDGKRLAISSQDETAQIWDARTGDELFTVRGHTDDVLSVAFSPDGSYLTTSSADNQVKVWDALTGEELFTIVGHTGFVSHVTFSPDGARLATASLDGTAKVWDVSAGHELLALGPSTDTISSVAFSPDARSVQLAMTGPSTDVTIWDSVTGQLIRRLSGHTDFIDTVTYSPDGAHLATASRDQTIRVWDTADGKTLLVLPSASGINPVVAFSPDGQRLAGTGPAHTATVWDAATGAELLTLSGHSDSVYGIAFSPDGTRLVTASIDGVRVWDSATGRQLLVVPAGSSGVNAVAFSPKCPGILAKPSEFSSSVGAAPCELLLATSQADGSIRLVVLLIRLGRHDNVNDSFRLLQLHSVTKR